MEPTAGQGSCGKVRSCIIREGLPNVCSWIQDHAPLYEVPPGNLLFREGDQPHQLIIICSGTTELSYFTAQGRTAIRKLARAGDLLGVTAILVETPLDASAMTMAWCQPRFLKKDDFSEWLESVPELRERLSELLAQALYAARVRLRELLLRVPTQARLGRLLLTACPSAMEASRQGSCQRVRLRCGEIAGLLGVTQRGLYKAMKEPKRQGLIERRPGMVVILDPEHRHGALAAANGEDEAVI